MNVPFFWVKKALASPATLHHKIENFSHVLIWNDKINSLTVKVLRRRTTANSIILFFASISGSGNNGFLEVKSYFLKFKVTQ
jgi:hypothetical protein